jgi:hypothetical protein
MSEATRGNQNEIWLNWGIWYIQQTSAESVHWTYTNSDMVKVNTESVLTIKQHTMMAYHGLEYSSFHI